MKEKQPKHYRFQRVFSTKKHVNGTVLSNCWSEKFGDWIYEINLDAGGIIWDTEYSILSEKPIKFFVGQRAYSKKHGHNCTISKIVGYDAYLPDWLINIELPSGEVVRIPQNQLIT